MSLELEEQYDKIYRYCYFKVNNKQLAEDLTQETFVKYFSQSSYISRGKPLAYLYTIAKNLCIDSYRKKKELLIDDDNVRKEIIIDNNMSNIEINIDIKQAISSLPKDLQEIILLRYANDLKLTEIAKITGISRFALYRKINNAIKILKSILSEEDCLE